MKVWQLLLIIIGVIVGGIFAYKYISQVWNSNTQKVVSAAYLPLTNIKQGPIVSFNFDDGFESAFKVGMPIIDAAGFKTTHYIVSNRIGESGYMNRKQILTLQSEGHEIGAHSLTHSKLTEMSLAKAKEEIVGSKEDLLDMGISKVATFAYPNGDHNNAVVALVKESGFSGARITNPGLNDKTTDPYKLLYLGMNSEISFEKVKQVVDETVTKRKWLILVFHRVGETGFENVSADFLQKTVDYVKAKNVPVVTTAQGLFIVSKIAR